MKRCARCERVHPETDAECPYCHYREEGPAVVAAHIDFLLGEVPQWVNRAWIDREKAALLRDVYTRRRDSLRPAAAPSAPLVVTHPPLGVPRQPEAPPPPSAPRTHPLATFLEERNISYWHLVGAVLLLAGLSGLVRYTWNSAGKYLVFVLMIAVTAGFYALGRTLTRQGHHTTGWALRAVSLLLVPLDLIAINAFALGSLHLSTNTIGLLTAGLCLPLYAWRAVRERLRCFDITLTLDLAATLHFALQTLLPSIVKSHSPLALYGAYGFFYLPVAFAYFIIARRSTTPERRTTWIISAHAMALGSLVLAVWPGGSRTLGDASATVLLAAMLYTATAFLIDEPLYAWLSSLMGFAGFALAFSRHGASAWYWYAAFAQVVALASYGLCRLHGAQSREQTALGYAASAWLLTVGSLVLQLSGLYLLMQSAPHFALAQADLYGASICALLSLGFLWLMRMAPLARILVSYLFVLAGVILGRMLPAGVAWHDTPQIGLPLALASLVFLVTARDGRRSAVIAGVASLAISCLYAITGIAYGLTLASLALVLAVMAAGSIWRAGDGSAIERQAMLWTGAGAATVGALLWETHLLPFLHAQLLLEKNYGYGLIPLIALAIAHGSYWRARGQRQEEGLAPYQIAGVIGVLGVAIQLYDSSIGLPYSPLVLLGLGVAAGGAYAVRNRSQIAAGVSAFLVLSASLAYGVYELRPSLPPGTFGATMSIRETSLIAILAGSSALFAAIATRLRMRGFAGLAVIAGLAGVLFLTHLTLHPANIIYSLVVLPVLAALFAIAYSRPQEAGDLWFEPLRNAALRASLLAILPVIGPLPLLAAPAGPIDPRGLWCLLGYALLWAGLAVKSGELHYVYLSAFAASGAYLYGLYELLSSSGVIGFDVALGAFAWAAVAVLLALTTKVKEQVTLAFHHVATTLILIALLLAFFGDGKDQAEMHTLLVSGAVFFANQWRMRSEGWQHAGVACFLWAYYVLLARHTAYDAYGNGDIYFAPVGVYLLVLGFLGRRRLRGGQEKTSYQFYYITGLALIMGPTLLALRHAHDPAIRASLLATECVLAIFYGLTARVKAFVGMGTAFLIALIAMEAQGNVSTIAWAIYATVLGLAVIGSALYIERRRDRFTRWSQSVRERMKDWE